MSQIVKNQHYIPRSYLKNFGYLVSEYTRPSGKVDQKYSIHNIEKGGEIKHNSTKKICKMDYLYDLPFADEKHKQFIEKAYDQKTDKHFTEVTRFIEDDQALILNNEMREKILKCGLSLYFRTPKHVALSDRENLIISKLPKNKQQKLYDVFKTKRLKSHIENFDKLFHQKKNNGISINKAVGDWDFISGDNPVIVRGKSGQFEGAFDVDSIIHIPFTPKYSITIMPDNTSNENPTFNRYDYSNDSIMTINHDIEQHHEQYVFGTERALNDYLNESPIYKAPVLKNHPKVLDLKNTVLALQHFTDILEKHGPLSNQAKTVFLYYWNSIPGFRKDPNTIKLKEKLGY